MKKHLTYKVLFLLAVFSAAFIFSACSTDVPQTTEAAEQATETAPATEESESMADAAQTSTQSPDATDENTDTSAEENLTADGQRVFTLEELAQYNGKDGNPAYVAVDGVVYDVSDKALWSGGEHQNKVSAGQDLSEEILSSPHGKSKLSDLPIVGVLAEE